MSRTHPWSESQDLIQGPCQSRWPVTHGANPATRSEIVPPSITPNRFRPRPWIKSRDSVLFSWMTVSAGWNDT